METSIGVFGEEVLLWLCMLRQSPRRPPADHVLRQANLLLEELKGSRFVFELPSESIDDGMFAIAAFADELAMSLPDLRPSWAQRPLQALRWGTNNAGAEFFDRLERVKKGPRVVMATYACVLGLGFRGRYGLPGQSADELLRIRRELSLKLGVDPDRDWNGGVLRAVRVDGVEAQHLPNLPLWKSTLVGRIVAAVVAAAGVATIAWTIAQRAG